MGEASKTIDDASAKALRNFVFILAGGAGVIGLLWLGFQAYELFLRVNEQGVVQALLR